MSEWTFLTNHGHVLLCIVRDAGIRVRDVAQQVGITERAAQRIVSDLVANGYLTRGRDGRRNHYQVCSDRPPRHPVEQPHRIGERLDVLATQDSPGSATAP